VSLSDGTEIFSSTLIWVSGVVARKADGIPETSLGKGRRILVDEFNRVYNLQDVFAIGDRVFKHLMWPSPTAIPNLRR
jgi:NADH dehydrogenase